MRDGNDVKDVFFIVGLNSTDSVIYVSEPLDDFPNVNNIAIALDIRGVKSVKIDKRYIKKEELK